MRDLEPYVPGTPVEEAARALGMPPAAFVKLASNENPLGMSPLAAEAVRAILPRAARYPEADCPGLRAAVAATHGVEPATVLVGNGADGVLTSFFTALVAEGDEVVIPALTFSVYATVVRAMRGRVVASPMRGLRIDVDDLLARVGPRTKAVCVCNPNNPTGDLLARGEVERLLDRIPENVVLALDEVYGDFTDPALFASGIPAVAAGRRNVFVFRSCSKIYGLAGLRVGWGIGHPALVAAVNRVRPPFDVSVVAAAAAEAALGDTEFRRRTLEVNAAGMRLLAAELSRLGCVVHPSHTNFLLVDVRRDARELAAALMRCGVIVRAGFRSLPTHLRVTVGTEEQNRRFLAAMEQSL